MTIAFSPAHCHHRQRCFRTDRFMRVCLLLCLISLSCGCASLPTDAPPAPLDAATRAAADRALALGKAVFYNDRLAWVASDIYQAELERAKVPPPKSVDWAVTELADGGHMVSFLLDLEDANSALPNTDIVVIVGANDVVNPAAEDDPGSPIYGMPVLKVWEAKNVIVLKRSMRSGYAGIENPLFFHDRTRMLFGDAKDTLTKFVAEIKTL